MLTNLFNTIYIKTKVHLKANTMTNVCVPIIVFEEFTQIYYIWMSTTLYQNLNFLQNFHSASFGF